MGPAGTRFNTCPDMRNRRPPSFFSSPLYEVRFMPAGTRFNTCPDMRNKGKGPLLSSPLPSLSLSPFLLDQRMRHLSCSLYSTRTFSNSSLSTGHGVKFQTSLE